MQPRMYKMFTYLNAKPKVLERIYFMWLVKGFEHTYNMAESAQTGTHNSKQGLMHHFPSPSSNANIYWIFFTTVPITSCKSTNM